MEIDAFWGKKIFKKEVVRDKKLLYPWRTTPVGQAQFLVQEFVAMSLEFIIDSASVPRFPI